MVIFRLYFILSSRVSSYILNFSFFDLSPIISSFPSFFSPSPLFRRRRRREEKRDDIWRTINYLVYAVARSPVHAVHFEHDYRFSGEQTTQTAVSKTEFLMDGFFISPISDCLQSNKMSRYVFMNTLQWIHQTAREFSTMTRRIKQNNLITYVFTYTGAHSA